MPWIDKGPLMIAVVSIASFAGGCTLSCCAERVPMSRERAELIGGLLLVAGLAIVGFGLSPLFR